MKRAVIGIAVIIGFSAFVLLFVKDADAPSNQVQQNSPEQTEQTQSNFDKQAHSLEDPGSIWIVASKVSPLSPLTYAPTDLVVPNVALRSSSSSTSRLRKEAATALEEMLAAAKTAGISIGLTSAYRSYQYQVSLYNGYVQKDGQAGADKYSARPGTSEHQTGFAADLEPNSGKCRLEVCFADTPEGKWLAANAHLYGFILRYPEGKQKVTGYTYEPWHFRYVGKDLSMEMSKQGVQTMEEFFNIVPASQPY